MHINLFLAEALPLIESTLDTLLPREEGVFGSARYSLFTPGKRLRPLLALATATSYGISLSRVLIPACALELIHTYSLIHDDLPCMDNDDFRRGKPSLHKVVPEWQALLTGDYLLTYAFELLSTFPDLSCTEKLELIQILSKAAGAEGMIGGQMLDLLSEGKTLSWETLEQMHKQKTAQLIVASLEFGAIFGKAPPKDRALLKQIGNEIGLAFQLIDDLLDGTSDKNKATSLTLLGSALTEKKADELLASVDRCLAQLSCDPSLLKSLCHSMVKRTK